MLTMKPYYQSQSKCGKVRIIAAPFGYGPRVAAETMAKLLNLTISGWHINSTPIKNERFEITYNFGVAQPINEPETSYRIWVDCLMWLRNKIPQGVADYDLFLAENFFPTNPILHTQINGSKIKDIAPLYSLNGYLSSNKMTTHISKVGHVLVSFGGVETPFTTDIHRYAIPEVVLKSLVLASRKLHDNRKIVCCLPSHFLKRFQLNPNFSDVQFLSPNHIEFLPILNNASLYVVQPGLYGPFEAFENGIPIVFTTPFSYTQVCQAKAYDKEELMGHVPMWKQLDNEIGDLFGDIENEEEYCFDKISNWIKVNIKEDNCTGYYEWAEGVMKNERFSEQMTNKRVQYVKNCKHKKENDLREFTSNLETQYILKKLIYT